MKEFGKPSKMQRLTMRFSNGGAGGGEGNPPADPPAAPAPLLANPADPPAKTYTEADLEQARQQAVSDYQQRQSQQIDYSKMTAEEKVTYLEAQRTSDQLEQHATKMLVDAKLSVELLPLAKGKDEADTALRVKQLKDAVAKEVQVGVEARFKANAWQPRGSSVTTNNDDAKPRERGVKIL